jgi:cation-transporting ATPase E
VTENSGTPAGAGVVTSTRAEDLPGAAPSAAPRPVTPAGGLDDAAVAARVGAGLVNRTTTRTSRTAGEILRANVFTVFNGVLLTLFALVVATGRLANGLFVGIVVVNAVMGTVQELRAKRTLDRLALLAAAPARVVRGGVRREVPVDDVVVDDLLELSTGDQVPVDGLVRSSAGMAVDEALLTGESEPVAKSPGDGVRSGSIVVSGSGRIQATAVGDLSYAAGLANEARRFARTWSELVSGTNRILRWIAVLLVVVGPVVLWGQFRSPENDGWRDALTGTVAALVGMTPEGLVLLTTLAFLVAALGLARRQVLVQELPAVEGLARVDVVAFDKTGTLTYGDVRFDRLEPLEPVDGPGDGVDGIAGGVHDALGLLAAGAGTNATAAAIGTAFPAPGREPEDRVPFSSARKWSAMRSDGHTWVLGAPEMVLAGAATAAAVEARRAADVRAAEGRRVLLLARGDQRWSADGDDVALPGDLVPVCLVVLAERVREDTAEVLRYFTEQGVALKVISGDNPRTVGRVAAAVGVPGVSGADDAVDARTLPEDGTALAAALEEHSVFGRVSPHQKRAMVAALRSRGHVVAMTGDGVNDALALKDADIGVAMGNGSPATRAVAQLVLLDGRFAHLPVAVAEGRRVIANIERAGNLFLTKNVYSLALALITVATAQAYPVAPVQMTLVSAVTVGVPGFFLALGPSRRRYVPGFLRRVLRFSVPVGLVVGGCAYAGYGLTRLLVPASDVEGARTTTTLVILALALWTLLVLARPLAAWKVVLVAAMAAVAALVLVLPGTADLLDVDLRPVHLALAGAVALAGIALIEGVHRAARPPADARAG